MSIKLAEFPSLQALCGKAVHQLFDNELLEISKRKGALKAYGPSSLSLQTSKVLELFEASSKKKGWVPGSILDTVGHELLLIEWQKKTIRELQKIRKQSCENMVFEETERVWRRLCEQNGYLSNENDPEMTWEQRYFKERIAKTMLLSYGNFKEIDPREWALFYLNRSRVQVLDFDNNPYLTESKLAELCELFNEVRWFKVPTVFLNEKEWKMVFKKLNKVEHVNLNINMTIDSKAMESLADHASHFRSLDLSGISFCVNVESIKKLLKKANHLETLSISRSNQLNENQLLSVLSLCPALKILTLKNFEDLTFSNMEKILRQHPSLEKLTLDHCPNLKGQDMHELSLHPHLVSLIFLNCRNFHEESTFSLNEKFPGLERLSVRTKA